MKYFIQILIMLIIIANVANSQQINKWISLDTAQAQYQQSFRAKYIDCFDKDNLIALDQQLANTQPFLKQSADGGVSWDTLLFTEVFSHTFNSLAYPAKNHLYVVGDSCFYLNMTNWDPNFRRSGVIFSSFDNGKNWNKLLFDTNTFISLLDMSGPLTGLASKRPISNVFKTVENNGDTLIWTNDGFVTIEKILLPETGLRVDYLKMFSEDNFTIRVVNSSLGINKFYRTSDRGKTWVDDIESKGVLALSYVDNNNIFKIQRKEKPGSTEIQQSLIFKTTDGGANWDSCYTIPNDLKIDYISAADANNIIVVGEKCIIYHSNDGGKSWRREFIANGVNGIIDNEGDKFTTIEYCAPNTAYGILAGRMLKMLDEKILDRPTLYSYNIVISPMSIISNWSKVDGAVKYRYQLSKPKNNYYDYKYFDNIVFDTIIAGNSVLLPNLEYNKCYYGRVKAIGNNIEGDWQLRVYQFCTLQDSNYVIPPFFVSPTLNQTLNGDPLKFIWTSASAAKKYDFQISPYPNFDVKYLLYNGTSNDTSISVTGINYPQYEIFARVRVNDGTIMSGWRNIIFYFGNPDNVFDEINNDFIIYPNPANDYIEISLPNSNHTLQGMDEKGLEKVQIFDVLGIEVSSAGGGRSEVDRGRYRIDISHLSAGVYFIKIGNRVEKFVKM